MAKCRECGTPVIWAMVSNGKDKGKKRPFDVDGKTDGGRYGLAATEETDTYGNQVMEAKYYEDSLQGFAEHEKLFDNHFFTCPNKKGGKVYRPNSSPSGASDRVFVNVQIGADDYSGYVQKVTAGSASVEEEPPF